PRWHGQCPSCSEWNALVEERAPAGRRARAATATPAGRPVPLRDVSAAEAPRLRTGIEELDRVLGGGLVPGSLVLLGGSPGIGKSALAGMALGNLGARGATPGIGKSTLTGMALGNLGAAGHKVLYVSGEESTAQVKLRAERLGAAA